MFDTNVFQGLGLPNHERTHEHFRVVLQPVLMHELARKFVEGKPNSLKKPADEYVVILLRKFGGRYVFMSPFESLCARELRGERLRLDGEPYTQAHVDAFDAEGRPVGLVAPNGEAAYVTWINRVLAGKKARDPNEEPVPEALTSRLALGDADPLLAQLGEVQSNEQLLARIRAVLSNPAHAEVLIRSAADASTRTHAKARERLRADALATWKRAGEPPFTAYPYAMHCTEVLFLYFGGIKYGKAREADNDPGDLEHLKSMPFVSCVASDDLLVREIGRILARADQRVISKHELLDELAAA